MKLENVPKHLGIIMDGNRRFSAKLMMKPWKGHEWGVKKTEAVINWCMEYDIKELTLYTFSMQNFDRPKKEFNFLMKVFSDGLDKLAKDERIFKNKIKVNFVGRIWLFPEEIRIKMERLMETTKKHDRYTINFAMAYGGREEVIDATIRIAEKIKKGEISVKEINEELFRKYLYIDSEPDLIIRTGGESRTSNFLAFQGAYSEYIFIEKMWPEFEKEDFRLCMQEYSERKRRFGK